LSFAICPNADFKPASASAGILGFGCRQLQAGRPLMQIKG